jgi:hypothetical protein
MLKQQEFSMRILTFVLAAALLASLAACKAPNSHPNIPAAQGTYISSYAMAAGKGAHVRIGGINFHILQNRVSWDGGGSLKLQPNWGLLELREHPNAVDISLDGVVLGNAAK